jgi:hypothetical protein
MVALFSTSNVKVACDGVGDPVGEALAGAGPSEADRRRVGGSDVGPAAGEQAPSAIRSAVNVRRIYVIPLAVVVARWTEPAGRD